MNPLAEKAVHLLTDRGLTLGSCESMTAGLFAATIAEVPGASKTLLGGLITYDPRLKVALAEVSEESIEHYGIVSCEVASEMAKGAAKALQCDVCLSVSGNAGPTAQEGAEVGDVAIAIAYDGQIDARMLKLEGDRDGIRKAAVEAMLELLLEKII
ncbi:MAG: CinA family protein [Bacillota bacterium]|nr:CinA family protein [Bacillota bacterium]